MWGKALPFLVVTYIAAIKIKRLTTNDLHVFLHIAGLVHGAKLTVSL